MTITTAYQAVFVGTAANDGTGDDLRSAFEKVNSAFGYMGNAVINTVDIDASGTVSAGYLEGDGSALTNLLSPVANALPSYSGNIASLTITGNLTVSDIEVDGNIFLSNNYIPTLANSTGDSGQIAYDSSYVYICIANNTWKRANLVAW